MHALRMIGDVGKASVPLACLTVVLSCCSIEQVERSVYNAARGELCIVILPAKHGHSTKRLVVPRIGPG